MINLSFDMILAVTCSKPMVTDGSVTCTTPDGIMTEAPQNLDTCTASCDNGFSANLNVVTCSEIGGAGAFDAVLACEGK